MVTRSYYETKNIEKLFKENALVKICAPMVRYSKLQFRNLVREYDCDLCYTPMILADSFCQSSKARINEFSTNLKDTPVIVQFAANTVHDFVGASYMVSPYCSGVDLNCGCPQKWAKQMGLGCSLLDKPELIADMVTQCRNRICKPFSVSVKLRISKDERKTIEICKRLEKAGVSFIAIHARTSSQHTGEINRNILKLAVENVQCPIVSNGGVKNLNDCIDLHRSTNCKGVMVANSILTNPTLFSGSSDVTTLECVQKWLNICYNSTLDETSYLQEDDLESIRIIPDRPKNLTFQCFHHHLVFMLEKMLTKSQKRIFNNLRNFTDVLTYLEEHFNVIPQLFNKELQSDYKVLNLNYDDKDELYNSLKSGNASNNDLTKNNSCNYNYEDSDGKFFSSKLSEDAECENYDLLNIFN